MTEGFDAATPQASLNFAAISGEAFVFVKATGAQVGLYVAPDYVREHDAARAKGLHLGHYHLTGTAASIPEQAAFFVRSLRSFDVEHDALALDNERFADEAQSVMWGDGQVAEFWSTVFRLLPTFPHHHAFTYGDLSHLSGLAPWDRTNALGTRWWVAAYGANDGSRGATPHVPGCTTAIHQYTSEGRLAGVTVDRDWSPLSVEELFGAAAPAAAAAKAALAAAQAKTRAAAAAPVPHTSTAITGHPGSDQSGDACWMRVQLLARLGGYAGVIDGRMGPNSWKGVQRFLAGHYGYGGPIDGDPGVNTWKALQRLAAHHGYSGVIDGELGVESWRHLAAYLNTL